MRNMSFSLTADAIRNRTKTVTRRLGWKNLKPGEKFRACVKCMGLKKGEKIEVLAVLECVSNRSEILREIKNHPIDCTLEGFPEKSCNDFILMFCKHMGGNVDQTVNRIEFKYVEAADARQP